MMHRQILHKLCFRSMLLATWLCCLGNHLGAEELRPDTRTADTQPISLAEVLRLALQHNPRLGASVAERDNASGNVLSARGLDDLVLEANTTWNDSRRPIIGGVPVQTTAYDDILSWLQLTQPLPSGGRIGLRVQNEWTRSEYRQQNLVGGFEPSSSLAFMPAVQLVLSHPLLRGAGLRTARVQRFRAEAAYDQAQLQRLAVVAEVVQQVTQAYWELALAREEASIFQTLVVSTQQQLAVVNANIEVGKMPPSASAEVMVALALRQEEMLIAQQTVAHRSLELRRLAGLQTDADSLSLRPTTALTSSDSLPSKTELFARMREYNYQYRALKAALRVAAADVNATRYSRLPQLDVTVAGGPQGNASDLMSAWNQLGRFQAYGMTASVVFSLPVPQRAARGAQQSAQAQHRRAQYNLTDFERQIESALLRERATAELAQARVETLTPAVNTAVHDLEAEQARFNVGRASTFDVLRRQEEVAQVQRRRARAQADYLNAIAALDQLTTQSFTKYEVQVP